VATEHPIIFDFAQDAAAYLNALHTGATIEITEGTFDYFLEVLPPVYMGRTLTIEGQSRRVTFGFAEGAEPITAFWTEQQQSEVRYFCKRTEEVNRS
jgi:hypothetical protein